jgi:hypothetical protein
MPITFNMTHTPGQTMEVDLQTCPPIARVGNGVYRIDRVRLLTASNMTVYAEPDDSRLHSIVSGFNKVYPFGVVLSFQFTPRTLLGHDNIVNLMLIRSPQPMTEAEIAAIVTHNAHAGEQECPICYETDSGPWFSCQSCRHEFHHTCIGRWFQAAQTRTCPLCRAGI